MDDTVAQFMAVTSSEADTAQQYLEASEWNLEQAVELFFASGGASIESQTQPPAAAAGNDDVRERIEGFHDQLIDEEAQLFNNAMRDSRRAEARARKPRGIFNQDRDADFSDQPLSKHERRLANLFRPPFDMISDISLDEAKEDAKAERKLIMVNVQDSGEFACQRLNRDLWRSPRVKEIVVRNFVFLQYDIEDPDGEDYRVLYPFEAFPHIAIIDPWTGEQQRTWSKVPEEAEFIEDIVEFIANFRDEFPTESAGDAPEPPAHAEGTVAEDSSESTSSHTSATEPEQDIITSITPSDIPEPPNGPDTTRIQLRYGDGKRTVRRFRLEDKVEDLYAITKHILGVTGRITLTSERRDLQNELGQSIEGANLKNSTILVEVE